MTAFRLEPIGEGPGFLVGSDRSLVVGRSPQCDVVLADPSVSRRHAEFLVVGGALTVRDLASANGTLVNGERCAEARLLPGDVVALGQAAFRVVPVVPAADSPTLTAPPPVVASGPLDSSDELPAGMTLRALAGPPTDRDARAARVLDRLLAVSAGLSSEASLEPVLRTVTDLAFDQVEADRVALLLADPASGALQLAAHRNRVGEAAPQVPRVIAARAVEDRVPVLTASAVDDERFQSGSVVLQAVRSAVCVPLLDAEGQVLGALYADTITREHPFDDAEARALLAFGGLAAVVIARARYAAEIRRAREVRSNFERFFAPSVAAAIAQSNERVALGGRRVPATVLFTDIRGFTALAESLPPEEIAALLEEYFAVAVEAVFEQDGTLDKFVGDAVMAVWGAPLPCPDPVDRALAAALAIRRDVAALNQRRATHNRPPVALGIGIGYGEVFAGTVGTERRLEYTVVGDAVNVAAHLASVAPPGQILLAGPAADRLTHRPRLIPMPELSVKSRSPVQVYRV